MNIEEIELETKKVFDSIYTVEDIISGDTIEMNKQAREIAIKNIKEKEIETFTFKKIPTWALPALTNGDYKSLTDEELNLLSPLEESLPSLGMDGHWGNYSEEYYSSTTSLDNYGGNVVDIDYIITKEKIETT